MTQPGIDRPYRVIVWGPGHIGGTVLREVIKRDDLELVGVKVYSEEKAGADAGAVAVRTHRGYIGERLVYTNVEYWYWGRGCRYIGPENDVPFGPGDSNLDYVIDIAGPRVTSGCVWTSAITPATTSRSPLGFRSRRCCSRSDRSSPPSRGFSITNQVRISVTCDRVSHWKAWSRWLSRPR